MRTRESLNLNRKKKYNNHTKIDWIQAQEKIIGMDSDSKKLSD